jgi:cytochrome bd-type quinol oxidase subunit 2
VSRREAWLEVFKLFVVLALIGIVVSLGSALFHLVTDKGDSKKMVRALTVRIGLSVSLFIVILAAWAMGIITPHGVVP